MKKKVYDSLIVLFALIFFFASGMTVRMLVEQYREKRAFDLLAQEVRAAEESLTDEPDTLAQEQTAQDGEEPEAGNEREAESGSEPVNTPEGEPAESGENETSEEDGAEEKKQEQPTVDKMMTGTDPETGILRKYLALYQRNQDLFGWLEIEGTRINYPVMYTPEDQEYYLRRAFDGSDSNGGTLFLDARYSENGNLYLIYGHKMRNKTMFGTLTSYSEESYFEKHPVILFDTLYGEGEYEVVAAFYSEIYDEGEEGFRYYEYGTLDSEERFAEFWGGVAAAALYDTGNTLTYGDTVLMLSTCSYHTENGRFVVVARKRK